MAETDSAVQTIGAKREITSRCQATKRSATSSRERTGSTIHTARFASITILEDDGKIVCIPFLSHLIDHLNHVDVDGSSPPLHKNRVAVFADPLECFQPTLRSSI